MWTKTAVHLDATDTRPEGWHFAQVWSNGGGPIGYCSAHDPHSTEEEARLCYGQFLREHVKHEHYGNWTNCEYPGCGQAAKDGFVSDGYHSVALCAGHCSEDHALEVLGLVDSHGRTVPAGDSMGS